MLILLINIAHAVVELPNFETSQDIGNFIGQIYSFSLTVAGIVIFVRFIYAGFLYLTAAGNTSNVSRARSIMINGIWGVVLLFSAYLILNVINPDLVCNTFNFGVLTGNQPTVNCQ